MKTEIPLTHQLQSPSVTEEEEEAEAEDDDDNDETTTSRCQSSHRKSKISAKYYTAVTKSAHTYKPYSF